MVERKVVMRGPAVRHKGSLPSAAGAVLLRLENSLRGTVDVAFRKSSAPGWRQAWLRLAGEVEFQEARRTGTEEMTLCFAAPLFFDVARSYYGQPALFDDGPCPEDTAFDVLADAIGDVMACRTDSDKYDLGLLRRFHRFGRTVFQKGVAELELPGRRSSQAGPCRVSAAFAANAERLYLQTPEPTRVRIAGRLDMIQASTLAFALLLPGGQRIRGIWKGRDFDTLKALVNTDVAASGLAIYRPSGSLLRVDADALTPQREGDLFFATVPAPSGGRLDIRSLVRQQQNRGGMAAVWGQLPAEESDEAFLAAVAEMD
jgi:hypothetical protein